MYKKGFMMRKLTQSDREKIKKLSPDGLIFLCYRGSISHGMHVPNTDPNSVDDIDLMGVFINPIEHYFGFGRKECYETWVGEYDSVHYELRKVVGMLLKANPNVMSLLWLGDNYIIQTSDLWWTLRANRNLFVSKKLFNSFSGYAMGQMKKMTSFTKEGYMGQKRKSLVEKFGYDTKNAAHLIRLLRMGREFMKYGELFVDRTYIDADELLAIKRGEWKLEDVKALALETDKSLKAESAASTLPEEPNKEAVEKLLTELLDDHFKF
jgi:uncharacterized protein